MYGFIYMTTNNINGMKYIGMCKNTHSKKYLGSGKKLREAILEYGKENFTREILEECDSYESMIKAEKNYISLYNAADSDSFYNMISGGRGGKSESLKKFWSKMTKEEKISNRNWNRNVPWLKDFWGRKLSEETKRKIGAKSINRDWGTKTPLPGEKNPKAVRINVIFDSGKTKQYGCIKDFANEFNYNYATMKAIYRCKRYSEKYGIKIEKA